LCVGQVSHRSFRNHHPLRTSLIPWHLPKRPSPTQAIRSPHHAHFNVQGDFPTYDLMSIEQGAGPQNLRIYFPQLASVDLLLHFIRIAAAVHLR
jgi:hypothetical protein